MIGTSRFQHGSLMLVKNRKSDATWFLRFYEDVGDRRVYRKQRIGTVRELPTRRHAEKAVLALREKINSDVRLPDTVDELIHHYQQNELTEDSGKRSCTRDTYTILLRRHVQPKWGSLRLDRIKTVEVERWLRSLDYAPGTKSKIRNIMSAVFAHAKRYGMIPANPIQGVRCSAKRLREPDVLTPYEFNSLVNELPLRERVMVLLAGTTGLRRSELIALTWQDVDFDALHIVVNKSCVDAEIAATKTAASAKPVPLHPVVADSIREWKSRTLYPSPTDFLFPSVRNKGETPVWPDMVLHQVIRPAVERAGIKGKVVGWHTFRHSLGTNLRTLGIDIKTAQELLRHANVTITLNLYSQAISAQKREASERVVQMMLSPGSESAPSQHPSAPSKSGKEGVASVSR